MPPPLERFVVPGRPPLERYKTEIEGSGNPVAVNEDGQLHVVLMGKVDSGNSTEEILSIGGIFEGVAFNTLDYGYIFVTVFSDQSSATDGLSFQQSSDGSNWDNTDEYTIPANKGKTYSFQPGAKYSRIVYTNGGVGQGTFRLQTIFKKTSSLASSHRIQDSITTDDDAELVKAVLTGADPDGHFHNVNITHDGNLTISDNSNGLAIAKGDVSATTFIHKFGNTPDFDTADGIVDVWDGAEDNVSWEKFIYNYSSTADIDSIVSDSGSDTFDVEIQGLDTNYNLVTQTKTLTGQTPATLGTNLIRVFRMVNSNSTDNVGHVFCYVSGGTVTAGVPQTAADIRAIIQPENNQTLMALYTIPAGKTGYMRDWYASVAGASKSSNYIIDVRARPFGKVFNLKHRSALSDTGNSHIQHKYNEPEVFTEKTDVAIRVSATEVGVTAASISAGFDIVLVDN